jgi:hypothetical protein
MTGPFRFWLQFLRKIDARNMPSSLNWIHGCPDCYLFHLSYTEGEETPNPNPSWKAFLYSAQLCVTRRLRTIACATLTAMPTYAGGDVVAAPAQKAGIPSE